MGGGQRFKNKEGEKRQILKVYQYDEVVII